MNVLRTLILLLLPSVAPNALAGTWTLTTADFNRVAVSGPSLDGHSLHASGRDGAITVPIDQVLRLDREAAPAHASAYTVFLPAGDRLGGGEVGDLKDDVLSWTSPVLGKMKLPLDGLRGIVRGSSVARLAEERKEDQVTLTNRDVVRGVVTGIEGGKVLVQVNGDVSPVPLTSADAILFASSPKPSGAAAKAFRVRFVEGSQLTVSEISMRSGHLTLGLPGGQGQREVDEANVVSVEQLNGPVRWLSDLTPISSEQASFNSESGFPAKMDRSVFGKPMRLGAQTYERGVGVHANSRLVFALDGQYNTFRTRSGVDTNGDAGRADINLRVLLDDKVVQQKKHVRAFDELLLVVPLGSAKTLTLEVTAAGPTDAQDRFDWAEAALVREASRPPASQPATVPAR